MKRSLMVLSLGLSVLSFSGCKKPGYLVHYKVLRQNTAAAEGFHVECWIKGKSEQHITKNTNAQGMAEFDELPFPDATHPLCSILHYYNGKVDGARDIAYPFLESDAKQLKDTQYIPNNATADPQ